MILPLSVTPSAPSRVTAPISFPLPISPIDIVSVLVVPESALTVRLVAVPEPLTALIEIAPPALLIVKLFALEIVPVSKLIVLPITPARL